MAQVAPYGIPNYSVGSAQLGSFQNYGQFVGRGNDAISSLVDVMLGTQPSAAQMNVPVTQTKPVQMTMPGESVPGVQVYTPDQSIEIWEQIDPIISQLLKYIRLTPVSSLDAMRGLNTVVVRIRGGNMDPLPEAVVGRALSHSTETRRLSFTRYGTTWQFSLDQLVANPTAAAAQMRIYTGQIARMYTNTIFAIIISTMAAAAAVAARRQVGDGTRPPMGFGLTAQDRSALIAQAGQRIGAANAPRTSPLQVISAAISQHNQNTNRGSGKMIAFVGDNMFGPIIGRSRRSQSGLVVDGHVAQLDAPFSGVSFDAFNVDLARIPPIFGADDALHQPLTGESVFVNHCVINPARQYSKPVAEKENEFHRMGTVLFNHQTGQYEHVRGDLILKGILDYLFEGNGGNDAGPTPTSETYFGDLTVQELAEKMHWPPAGDSATAGKHHQNIDFNLTERAQKIQQEILSAEQDEGMTFADFYGKVVTGVMEDSRTAIDEDAAKAMDAVAMFGYHKFLTANKKTINDFEDAVKSVANLNKGVIAEFNKEKNNTTSAEAIVVHYIKQLLPKTTTDSSKYFAQMTRGEIKAQCLAGRYPFAALLARFTLNETHDVICMAPGALHLRTTAPLTTIGQDAATRMVVVNASMYAGADVARPEDVFALPAFGIGALKRGGGVDILPATYLHESGQTSWTPDTLPAEMVVLPIEPWTPLAKPGKSATVPLLGYLSPNEGANVAPEEVFHMYGPLFQRLCNLDAQDSSAMHLDPLRARVLGQQSTFPRVSFQCASAEIAVDANDRPYVNNLFPEEGPFRPDPQAPYPPPGLTQLRSGPEIREMIVPVDIANDMMRIMNKALN